MTAHRCTGPDACSSCERAAEARVEDAGYADDRMADFAAAEDFYGRDRW